MNSTKLLRGLYSTILSLGFVGATQAATIDNTSCMQEAANTAPYNIGPLNCTSDDVKIASTRNVQILHNNCRIDGSGTVTFKADFELRSTASNRYNIGIYFSVDNDTNHDGALTGTCSVSTLPVSVDNPSDMCGDISSAPVVETITLTAPCGSLDVNGNLKLPYCTAWQNNDLGTCSGPTDAIPGNASKCRCESGSDFQIPLPGAIQAKVSSFEGDSTEFSFHVTGPNGYDSTLSTAANGEGAADFNTLAQGTYHLVENAVAGYVLVNATCNNGDLTIPQNADGSFDIDVIPGKVVTCDFSNAFPIEAVGLQGSLLSNADGDASNSISVGDVLTIDYAVTNTGNIPLTNIAVSDAHEGLSEITCDINYEASLGGGATAHCTATYTVTQADIDLGNIHDDNAVTAQGPSGALSAESSFDIEIAQQTLLSLTITPSSAVFNAADEVIGYVYEVTNSGNTTILGALSIADDHNLVVCPETTSLAPASSIVCTSSYIITADDLTAGSVTNAASALLGLVASNTAEATVAKPVATPVSTGGGGGGKTKPKPTQSSTSTPQPVVVTPPVSTPSNDLSSAQSATSGCGCNANATPTSNANWMLMSFILIGYSAWRRPSRQRRK